MVIPDIKAREWNDMGNRMASLRERLANQEMRVSKGGFVALERSGSDQDLLKRRLNKGGKSLDLPRSIIAADLVRPSSDTDLYHAQNKLDVVKQSKSLHSTDTPGSLKPLRPQEYEVLWELGKLGIALVEDGPENTKRIQAIRSNCSNNVVRPNDFGHTHAAVGDALVLVNEKDVNDYSMSELQKLLASIKKPVLLRFEKQQVPDDQLYKLCWNDGSLGLSITEAPDGKLRVKRFTGKASSSVDLSAVAVGDEIVTLNGQKCCEMGFEKSLRVLKQSPKPLIMCLRRERRVSKSPLVPNNTNDISVLTSPVSSSNANHNKNTVFSKEPQSDAPPPYSIEWKSGALGMTVRELVVKNDDKSGSGSRSLAIVSKNSTPKVHPVTVGDMLVSIGEISTRELAFDTTIQLLKTIEKPVVLKFQARESQLSSRK